MMAAAVARLADEAVVTSDNPRSEKPEAIIEEIMEGFPLDFPVDVVVDRREAIHLALTRLVEGDCLIIAGKGHETYQETAGVRRHFDDRGVVKDLDAAGAGAR
jgi:UDP-N-acetylmuramyl tripeptide synthase